MNDTPSPASIASAKSMRYVMSKKKKLWLGLFAKDACIEDPVGKSPLDETGKGHRGLQAIEKFWDDNIEPNSFVFNIKESISPQGSAEVANIGQIITRVPTFQSTTVTNGVFIYKVGTDGKIQSLRAFYQFGDMIKSSVRFPSKL